MVGLLGPRLSYHFELFELDYVKISCFDLKIYDILNKLRNVVKKIVKNAVKWSKILQN